MTTYRVFSRAAIALLLIAAGCDKKETVTDVDPFANYYNSLPTSESATAPIVKVGLGIEAGGYSLSWQDCPQASHYEIESGNVRNNWHWKLVYVTESTLYSAGEVPGNLQQKYRVRAVYEQFNSRWTEVSLP